MDADGGNSDGILMETSAVDADHDPRIGEQDIRLLEVLDVFESDSS
jgi:hypothetical protein